MEKRAIVLFSLGMKRNEPDAATRANIDAAVGEVRDGEPYDLLIVVGGKFAPMQTKSAAEVMLYELCEELNQAGAADKIPPVVIVEDESRTTRENIINIGKLLKEQGLIFTDYHFTVVSEKYHCLGIRLLF